jgi:hypothetical protein
MLEFIQADYYPVGELCPAQEHSKVASKFLSIRLMPGGGAFAVGLQRQSSWNDAAELPHFTG